MKKHILLTRPLDWYIYHRLLLKIYVPTFIHVRTRSYLIPMGLWVLTFLLDTPIFRKHLRIHIKYAVITLLFSYNRPGVACSVIKRPGLAGAVLQSPLVTDSSID